jgi:hypothetical protein
MKFKSAAKKVANRLTNIPVHWDGKSVITEMRDSEYSHWRQMEWIGFYFQYLCTKHLAQILQIPGVTYDKVEFDGFYKIPWDFKAHAMNTSSHQIIVNDSLAISRGISEYGSVGLILAMGIVEYNDVDRSFQKWHSLIKGGLSDYEIERIKRGAWSRLRKVSFELKQISYIEITDKTLVKSGSFQSDFRNSNGRPRKRKVLLDLEKLDDEIVFFTEF